VRERERAWKGHVQRVTHENRDQDFKVGQQPSREADLSPHYHAKEPHIERSQ